MRIWHSVLSVGVECLPPKLDENKLAEKILQAIRERDRRRRGWDKENLFIPVWSFSKQFLRDMWINFTSFTLVVAAAAAAPASVCTHIQFSPSTVFVSPAASSAECCRKQKRILCVKLLPLLLFSHAESVKCLDTSWLIKLSHSNVAQMWTILNVCVEITFIWPSEYRVWFLFHFVCMFRSFGGITYILIFY